MLGVKPYISFAGNCQEAIDFYKNSLGATELFSQKWGETPHTVPGFEDKIMHASFRVGESMIMASDGCGEDNNFHGFSLSITVPTEAEAQRVFEALSESGTVKMPLMKTFWAPCFGMLEDRFGLGWMVSVVHKEEGK